MPAAGGQDEAKTDKGGRGESIISTRGKVQRFPRGEKNARRLVVEYLPI